MKKRLLSLCLALAMCLALLPVSAFAADDPWACISLEASPTVQKLERTVERLFRDPLAGIITEDTVNSVYSASTNTQFTLTNEGGSNPIYVYLQRFHKVGPENNITEYDHETGEEVPVPNAVGKYYCGGSYEYLATKIPDTVYADPIPAGAGLYWIEDTMAHKGSSGIKLLNNGESVTFTLPSDKPDTLYYLVAEYEDAEGVPYWTGWGFFAGEQPTATPTFTDVPAGQWYAAPVDWAVSKDITNGTGNGEFSPGKQCTHAQILTFLYRASRSEGKAEAADMDKAVAWAREKGMIDGSFSGGKPCTRADAVNYIWQAFGRQSAAPSSFTDVPAGAGYAKAVDWAVANGITNGTNTAQTQFSPNDICTRGHIVTFLHRAYVPEVRLK